MAVSFAQSNVGIRNCADSGTITQGSVTTAAGDVLVIFDVAGRTAPWQTQWSIDGAAALTPLSSYDEAGEAAVVHMYAVTGLAAGSHTIDATNPASGGSTGRFAVYGWVVVAGADAAAIDSGDVLVDITGSTSAAKTWATGPVAANGGAIGFMASRAGAAVASVDHTNLGTVSTGGGTVSYSSAALQSYTTATADTDETMGVTFGGTGSGAYVGIVLAPAAVGTPATFTTLAGDATATGGVTAFIGAQAATFVALVGDATATGGSVSMQGAGSFAAASGSASAAGGSTTLAGQGILGATAGAAAASGGGVSMTGQGVLTASAGTATAAGGTVVMSAGSPATMVALTGAATAAGGTATLTGAGVLAVTSAPATASGGTASMSTGGTGTITALTGAATASGGAVAMSGQARFVATAAAATASGGTALLAGAATFLALAATATASGGVATSTGAARVAVLAGQALAAGGVAQMVVAGSPPDGTPADLTIHTGPASYTRIIPGPTARRTIHPGRTL